MGKVYEKPGKSGSVVSVKPRYDNFIGGKWVAPVKGGYMDEHQPGHRQAVLRGRPVHRGGRRARAGRRAQPRKDAWGEASLAERAAVLNAHRRRHRGQSRDARRRRDLGERQAGARDAGGGHPARHRPLPLLRRRHPLARGHDHRDRQGHRRLPLPRAARRRRPDHPLQLPAAHGGVEDRPGPGRRQLHGGKAGLADAVVDPQARRGHRRRGAAGRASTSSPARAARSARRWPRARASPRSASPARPRPAA